MMLRNFAIVIVVFAVVGFLFPYSLGAQMTTYLDAPRQFSGPLTYKDPKSGIVFYVESDGRHVSAINSEGRILWCKDPFAEAKLEFYRTKEPKIVYIGALNEWMIKAFMGKGEFIAITFNSSQFGVLNVATGEFTFEGQD